MYAHEYITARVMILVKSSNMKMSCPHAHTSIMINENLKLCNSILNTLLEDPPGFVSIIREKYMLIVIRVILFLGVAGYSKKYYD